MKAAADQGPFENIPLFVRANSLIPVAEPVQFVSEDTVFKVAVKVFGDAAESFSLFEDDGVSFNFEKGEQNRIDLSLKDGRISVSRSGAFKGKRYEISTTPVVSPVPAAEGKQPDDFEINAVRDGDPTALAGMSLISDKGSFVASSRFSAESGSGRLLEAVEGDDAFAFHTDNEVNPNVVIDLKDIREIAGISISNRIDGLPSVQERAASLAVWLSDNGTQWRALWRADGAKPKWNLVLAAPQRARFVKVGLMEPSFLHLRRVRIYGK